jgi:hypothetical protein
MFAEASRLATAARRALLESKSNFGFDHALQPLHVVEEISHRVMNECAEAVSTFKQEVFMDWKIRYRNYLDRGRASQSVPSKEAALMKASDLHHRQRAELYEIEGPNGRALRKEEIMRWMSAKKSQFR